MTVADAAAGPPDSSVRSPVFWEIIGSVSWFAMDGAWLFEATIGLVAALMVATVAAHLTVLALAERTVPALAVSGAMLCWVLLNVAWVVNDYEGVAWSLTAAKALFLAGAGLLLLGLIASRRAAWERSMRRFRRLRTGVE